MTVYHVAMQLPLFRAITTLPAASIALYAYRLTVPAFRATYTAPMPLVEIAGLQPRDDMLCRAPLFKKARGRPQVARFTAGEQRAQVAASMGPYGTFRSAYSAAPAVTKKDTISSASRPLNAAAAYIDQVEGGFNLSGVFLCVRFNLVRRGGGVEGFRELHILLWRRGHNNPRGHNY